MRRRRAVALLTATLALLALVLLTATLPRIVHTLRSRGYKLVTIPELVLDDPPQGHQPTPTSLTGD